MEVKARGERGVITADDKTENPYKVTFADGTVSKWLKLDELISSGLDKTKVLTRAMLGCAADVRTACEAKLSHKMREALRTVC